MPVWVRGLKIGALISLPMALGALMGENVEAAIKGFWYILIAGGIIGIIIDLIITKIAGQGKDLMD
jgi:pilus assembly protein TadC